MYCGVAHSKLDVSEWDQDHLHIKIPKSWISEMLFVRTAMHVDAYALQMSKDEALELAAKLIEMASK